MCVGVSLNEKIQKYSISKLCIEYNSGHRLDILGSKTSKPALNGKNVT